MQTRRTGFGVFTKVDWTAGDQVFYLSGIERLWQSEGKDGALANPNWIGIGLHRWVDPAYPFVFLNHSCEPNLAIRGEREFIALNDIRAGEQLTFDYATTEDEELWEMCCHCGASTCRRTIRAAQFTPITVFERYRPHINHYFLSICANGQGAA